MLTDDRLTAGLRGCTAALAAIAAGDLGHPVPSCPGWTFRELATHVGRGHRWAAEIVATRAASFLPMAEVPDGKLPAEPAAREAWLNEAVDLLADAVAAAGDDPVWTFLGPAPARWWLRRRAHEVAVHLADVQLATGREPDLDADLAADGIGEWLEIIAGSAHAATEVARSRAEGLRGDGQTLHFHATDPGLGGAGEWLVRRTPDGIAVQAGHAKADVAVRGPAARLLLVLTRRLPDTDPGVEIFGDQALFTHWLAHTPF